MTVSVSTTAQLIAALKTAHSGDTIELKPGNYSGVYLKNFNFAGAVTITSADASHPAVLKDLTLQSCSGLTLSGLDLSTAGAKVGEWGAENTIPFQVLSSSHITLDKLSVEGSSSATLATMVSGLFIRWSSDVSVTNSTFQYLHNAIDQVDNTGLTIANNSFSRILDDGIRGGGSSNVAVRDNTFTSFHWLLPDSDHPDCIQFWTSNTTGSASDITITGNVYTRGAGSPVQGVFVTDQVGDLPYLHLTIADNRISGALYNAIRVDDAKGAVVSGNTVIAYDGQQSWIDMMNTSASRLVGNTAPNYQVSVNNTGLTRSGNVLNQPVPIPSGAPPHSVGARVALFADAMSAMGAQSAAPIHAPVIATSPVHGWIAAPN